jgi:hypothetical protein
MALLCASITHVKKLAKLSKLLITVSSATQLFALNRRAKAKFKIFYNIWEFHLVPKEEMEVEMEMEEMALHLEQTLRHGGHQANRDQLALDLIRHGDLLIGQLPILVRKPYLIFP